MGHSYERGRHQPSGSQSAKLPWPIRLQRSEAWKILIAALVVVALADVWTGDLWFGPAYLLIIAGAAWCLGARPALIIGCAGLALGLATNGLALYPYAGIALAWNIAMRILIVLIVIVLATNVRSAFETEWRLARTDQLTGALNRKGFFELTFGISETRGWTLLAYADLDGLKKLNDGKGHRAGDDCLQAYSQQVTRLIRKGDIFARLRGDEFAIYMQVKDEEAAKAIAARLHAGMNDIGSSKHPIRCSLGALIIAPGKRGIDQELCSADELMYEAKMQGAALSVATVVHQGGQLQMLRRHIGFTLNQPPRQLQGNAVTMNHHGLGNRAA
jgi:diguanylate cyclase (GGDEF)-like protein